VLDETGLDSRASRSMKLWLKFHSNHEKNMPLTASMGAVVALFSKWHPLSDTMCMMPVARR
jgi:hypothetical protein